MSSVTFKPYLDYWTDAEEVLGAFAVPHPMMEAKHIELIVASYDGGGYDGYAFVCYRDKRDGKIYEVSASHCSCYGLEDQWSPEEVVVEELLKRRTYAYDSDNEAIRATLQEALG